MSTSPLAPVTSVKVKLGLLVAVSVAVAAVIAGTGAASGVPAWLSIPVTVALALGVTQLLALGMTSPLREMTGAARRMARGDYSTRVTATSGDEVGELARAFNRMAEDLAGVDRQRRELIANVSHELRTPMTALTAVLENLADGVAEPDPETLRSALAQAERLSALTGDLLDLARVDAGRAPLAAAPVRVRELLDRAVAETRVTGRDVTFEVGTSPADLTVPGDEGRLLQLVVNLLDNAGRHSPAGGAVRVGAERTADGWRLDVGDDGPGIPEADRERVFERFGTLTEKTDAPGASGGGTGLGLAIARWVTDLHGGRIHVVEPTPPATGAQIRVELPSVVPARPVQPEEAPMSPSTPPPATPPPAPVPAPARTPATRPGTQTTAAPEPLLQQVFGTFWPERGVPGNPRAVLACVAVGLLGGLVLPFHGLGVSTALVLLAAGAAIFAFGANRRTPFTLVCGVLCLGLAATTVLRDAEWIVVLCLLAGAGTCMTGLVAGRTLPAFALSAVAWPLSSLRGLPWLGRSLTRMLGAGTERRHGLSALRTAVLSVLALIVFGLLFTGADPLVASWADALVPDLEIDEFVMRGFVAAAVFGTVLAAVYLGINPPRTATEPRTPRPVTHRYEWLVPVLIVLGVFLVWLAAQATVFFGGHDYLQRSTGLTYAEYVHQGFGQLTATTALTLVVVWAAAHKAPRRTASDRAWLRGSLGALCLLTLVVVASALYRMHLYQEAYGFTRLRLLVDVFEGWLGLLVLGVLVAGVRLRAAWLPRAALVSGVAMLLGLALVNPDAWVARHNIDRYAETGQADWSYLSTLSDDAVPELAELPADVRGCATPTVGDRPDTWLDWNLGRHRAEPLAEDWPRPDPARCRATSG